MNFTSPTSVLVFRDPRNEPGWSSKPAKFWNRFRPVGTLTVRGSLLVLVKKLSSLSNMAIYKKFRQKEKFLSLIFPKKLIFRPDRQFVFRRTNILHFQNRITISSDQIVRYSLFFYIPDRKKVVKSSNFERALFALHCLLDCLLVGKNEKLISFKFEMKSERM